MSSFPLRRALIVGAAGALLCPGLLLAGARPASADATSDAQRAIQATYDKMNAALAAKNVNAALAYQARDFVATDLNGQKKTTAQLRADMLQVMPAVQSLRSVSRIQQFSLQGNTATVTVGETVRMTLVNPQNRQKANMMSNGVSRDTWVKQNGGWRLKRSQSLSSKSTVNGKPVPN